MLYTASVNERSHLDLGGLWVPIVTPFTSDGSVDEDSLSQLGRRLLNDGAAGLVALGTTGEPATLSLDERKRIVTLCAAECAAANRPLMVGAGTNSTDATIHEINQLTTTSNVDAALIVVPYYTRPSAIAIVEHFEFVADVSPVPIVVYNVPYRTGRGLGEDEITRLARHPNIVGLKQAVGSLDWDTLEVLRRSPNFAVLAGDDAFIAPTVLMGGAGAITASAHLCTAQFAKLVSAARAGEVERTRLLAAMLLPVVDAGFSEPNPAVFKGALHQLGELETDQLRKPLTSAGPTAISQLLAAAAAIPK